MDMDFSTVSWVAVSTFSLLKPFLVKWADSISSEIWKSIWSKIKTTFSKNWNNETISNLEKWVNDESIWEAKYILKNLIENDKDLFDFLKTKLPEFEKEIKKENTNNWNTANAINIDWNVAQNMKDSNFFSSTVNNNSENNNLEITKEILDKVNSIGKINLIISMFIAIFLFAISIWFVVYWISKYATIIFSWNNIVYIFWIPFIWWFLLLFLNLYFVKHELNFQKIKWEIELEKEKKYSENKLIFKEIYDYLLSLDCNIENWYSEKGKEVWFKDWNRVFEFIYRINFVQIAVAQKTDLKTQIDKIWDKIGKTTEKFWTSYYTLKIPYTELEKETVINEIKKLIDLAVN